jgi:hypothetical protein
MKVYSLYYKDGSFLGAFPSRELAVNYGKMSCVDEDAWDYDVIEEYLSKSPLVFTHPQYTSLHSLTPQQTTPGVPGVTLMPGTPQINNSVRAE